jgi:hypothetical protein
MRMHRFVPRVALLSALALLTPGCDPDVPTEPTGATAPRITGVTPQAPIASAAPQALLIHGERFSTGASLNLGTPDGATIAVPPAGIAELEPSSFRTTVVLALPGSYALTVQNSTGEVSPPFVLTVFANPGETQPLITAVLPPALTRSPAPQTVTVQGANFAGGLTVSVIDPDGLFSQQSASAIENLSVTGFQLTMVFGKVGTYALRVVNPSGDASNTANVVAGQ